MNPAVQPALARPRFLFMAMVVCWFLSLDGATTALYEIAILHEGVLPELSDLVRSASLDDAASIAALFDGARCWAWVSSRDLVLPLSCAKAVVSGFLGMVVISTLWRKSWAHGFLVQALAATLVLSCVSYYALTPVRAEWLGTVTQWAATLNPLPPEREALSDPALWWGMERARFFAFEIFPVAAAMIFFSRARIRQYFVEMSAAQPSSLPRRDS